MTIADRLIAEALREATTKIDQVLRTGARPEMIDADDLIRILDGLAQKLDPIPK